jgi:hypothetical protein
VAARGLACEEGLPLKKYCLIRSAYEEGYKSFVVGFPAKGRCDTYMHKDITSVQPVEAMIWGTKIQQQSPTLDISFSLPAWYQS